MASVAETRQEARAERKAKQQAELRRNFDFVVKSMHRHVNVAIDDRWSGYRLTNALSFTDSAKCRIGSIFGWVLAVASQDESFAIKAANDICGQLDELREYGGRHTVTNHVGRETEVSNFRVELSCDGTLHGFGVLWFARCADDYKGKTEPRMQRDDDMQTRYRFCMNGGLLYHGPGSGEVFAVVLGNGNRLWSIHT